MACKDHGNPEDIPMMTVKNVTVRRARSFASGVGTGLAAPILFISGAFEIAPSKRKATLTKTWRDVGKYIGLSANRASVKKRIKKTG